MKHFFSFHLAQLSICSFCIFSSLLAQARWMTSEEADAALETQETQVNIEKDGRYIEESEFKLKILNEKGRIQYGTLRYSYIPKNYQLLIKSPQTINPTQNFQVDEKDIVDTPIQATESGFSELREIVTSFPHVQIGSILNYKIKTTVIEPVFKNQFSNRFIFGDRYPQNQLSLIVHSKIQLYIQMNDPTKAIEYSKKESSNDFVYSFKLIKPVFNEVTDEIHSFLPTNSDTWIVISSKESFQSMFKELSAKYEKMLEEPLPASLQNIVDAAQNIKDPYQQMNTVLSSIADKIRYMGDWRSVDGGFIPRPLSLIASTHFGDCKDMSLLTTKILRRLGYTANISLVQRGTSPEILPDIPYNAFNHAIVTVLLPAKPQERIQEKRLWLDPTNFQSYSQGVMEDISDRTSLILKSPAPELQFISFTEPNETQEDSTYNYKFNNPDHRLDEIFLSRTGYYAAQYTGISLNYSKQQIEEEIITGNINKGDINYFEVSPFDLKSRVVTPINLSWKVDHHYRQASTSTGPGFTLRTPVVISDFNRIDIINRKSDYNLGLPSITTSRGSISNFEIIGNKIRNCDIKSPWLDFSMKIFSKSRPVRIESKLIIKKRWIKVADLQKAEFKRLAEIARNCSSDQLLIYRVPKIIDHN